VDIEEVKKVIFLQIKLGLMKLNLFQMNAILIQSRKIIIMHQNLNLWLKKSHFIGEFKKLKFR
jgi:hypothetical protein